MGGEQAAGVLATVKQDQLLREGRPMTEAQLAEFKRPTLEKYQNESSAYYSSARIWDDGIIDPIDTRQTIALGIESSLYREWETPQTGVFRM